MKSLEIRDHIDWFELIVTENDGLDELAADPNVLISAHIYWWSKDYDGGGFTLWPKQLAVLSDLNVELQVHFVFYGD